MASRKTLSRCAFSAAAACVIACGSSSSSPAPGASRVFVGAVSGSDARVGVVATDHNARIFFCGGAASIAASTHWFQSVPIDSNGTLTQARDAAGWSMEGTVADTGLSGMVTSAAGATLAFRADPVASGTIAGLYAAAGPCGTIGLIVAQSSAGTEATGQGACVPAAGGASPEQVNPIRPIERAADGTIPVTVGGTQSLVQPAAAPKD
jgi:hypothetical protein